jgi:aspartyl-tRNA(Asn)/glutamyl-tRNA(Gln) amidotransferase subunit B
MTTQARPSQLKRRESGDWEVVIGLEVHAQVTSNAKLFSGASTAFGGEPNSHVSLVDAAMPGMLPVINEECIRQAIRTGLGLKAKINHRSVFDRKNYFYPDLPQGYQISQYKSPIVGEGEVVIDIEDNKTTRIGIERLHLEQDAGKSLHDQHPTMSYVDLNRSGVALMEIVSKPELRSFDDAMNFMVKVRQILRYLGTCDGDMEKGSLRADVNVSVHKLGTPLGTRCEIKNVNSINFIGMAIETEARRQIEILEEGGSIEQETRLYDPDSDETRSMRTKEEAHDYRYFPDPDLLPLEITQAQIDEIEAQMPELPDEKRARFVTEYAIQPASAHRLVSERETADYFEAMVRDGAAPKAAANWILNEYMKHLNEAGLPIKAGPVTPIANSAIVQMLSNQTISTATAKEVLIFTWDAGLDPALRASVDPRQIVEQRGLKQVTDVGAIEKVVDEIVAKNPDKVADAKANPKAIGWFVGQVMKASGGKANPQAVNELLKKKLAL